MSNVIEHLTESGDITNMTKSEILQELITSYQGTCDTMEDEDSDWLSLNKMEGLFDDAIFECECCNWWCPVEELTQDESVMGNNCNECHPLEE